MKAHILIVDDNSAERFLARCTLEEVFRNGKIKECSDGQQALAFLARTRPVPDLILLDVNMPGMGGADILHSISESAELSQRLVRTTIFLFSNSPMVAETIPGPLNVKFVEKPINRGNIDIMSALIAERRASSVGL